MDFERFVDSLCEELWMCGARASTDAIDAPRFARAAAAARALPTALDPTEPGLHVKMARTPDEVAAQQLAYVGILLDKIVRAAGDERSGRRAKVRGHQPPPHRAALPPRPVPDTTPPVRGASDDEIAERDRIANERLALLRDEGEAERARLLEDRKRQATGLSSLWP